MLVSFATILGCLMMPWLAERAGRRGALAFYFALMMVFIALTFGKVFYLGSAGPPWFFVCLFFLGMGGANFSVYTLWLPEQYPTDCRASAFAFATSFARFGGAGITFLGRGRRSSLWVTWYARSSDRARLCAWTSAHSFRRRDARTVTARMMF